MIAQTNEKGKKKLEQKIRMLNLISIICMVHEVTTNNIPMMIKIKNIELHEYGMPKIALKYMQSNIKLRIIYYGCILTIGYMSLFVICLQETISCIVKCDLFLL